MKLISNNQPKNPFSFVIPTLIGNNKITIPIILKSDLKNKNSFVATIRCEAQTKTIEFDEAGVSATFFDIFSNKKKQKKIIAVIEFPQEKCLNYTPVPPEILLEIKIEEIRVTQ